MNLQNMMEDSNKHDKKKKIHCEAEHYGGNAKNKTQLYWS